MIDHVEIDTDERGFLLVVEGDFEEEARRYMIREDGRLALRLPQDAAISLLAAAEQTIGPWRDEMSEALRDFESSRDVPDPRDGYDPDDPKHPDWRDNVAAIWDEREGK